MNKINLKEFMGIDDDVNDIILCDDEFSKPSDVVIGMEKVKIAMLMDVVLNTNLIIYFDGRYVMEPYEGMEFKDEEEEFYYYNSKSYLVVVDEENNFTVRFRIKWIKDLDFTKVCDVVREACKYTKSHPEVSDYKLY